MILCLRSFLFYLVKKLNFEIFKCFGVPVRQKRNVLSLAFFSSYKTGDFSPIITVIYKQTI